MFSWPPFWPGEQAVGVALPQVKYSVTPLPVILELPVTENLPVGAAGRGKRAMGRGVEHTHHARQDHRVLSDRPRPHVHRLPPQRREEERGHRPLDGYLDSARVSRVRSDDGDTDALLPIGV